MRTDSASAHVFDANQENFETEVLQASLDTPIVVDFWATWCEPCKTLGPMLEKLAEQYQGAFRLAKIDVDQNRELAGMFGIRSIPTVVLLKNGEIADGFSGALPEGQLRAFLDKHVPPVAVEPEPELELGEESPAATIARLQAAIAAEPEQPELKLELAQALFADHQLEPIPALLQALPEALTQDPRALRLQQALQLAALRTTSPSDAELQQQIAADDKDWAAHDQIALRAAFSGQSELALQQWLKILQYARDWNDGLAKQRLLAAFGMLDDAELVGRYRRRMASLLF